METAALGKILTIDNLRKRHSLIIEWFCMCKRSEESIDHLLLHCSFATDIWSFVFALFGIIGVMPKSMIELLECWQGRFHCHKVTKIWQARPLCNSLE